MVVMSLLLAALGTFCILVKRSILGMVIGAQLIVFAGSSIFLISGVTSGAQLDGQVVSLLALVLGTIQVGVAMAYTVNLNRIRHQSRIEDLRNLRD